jgi:magnesium chelatase family protein
VNFDQMSSKAPGEPSAAIRERVIKARAIQSLRFKNHPGVHCNAQMTPSLLHQYAEPDAEGMAQLRQAITSMNMSARAYDRILKVARTIADLEASVQVRSPHIMEAIA